MLTNFFNQRLRRGLVRRLNNLKIARMARAVRRSAPAPQGAPVAFFKASTGIDDLSWNSGFHLLTSWALRLQGIPVAYFACHSGMSHCVLGTNRDDPQKPPPCKSCIYQSQHALHGRCASPSAPMSHHPALPGSVISEAPNSPRRWMGLACRN